MRGAARSAVTPRAAVRGRGGRGGRLRGAALGAAAASWPGPSGQGGGSASHSPVLFPQGPQRSLLGGVEPAKGTMSRHHWETW